MPLSLEPVNTVLYGESVLPNITELCLQRVLFCFLLFVLVTSVLIYMFLQTEIDNRHTFSSYDSLKKDISSLILYVTMRNKTGYNTINPPHQIYILVTYPLNVAQTYLSAFISLFQGAFINLL